MSLFLLFLQIANFFKLYSLFFPKAAILQQTAEYIFTLEQEKTRLLQQNSQLKRIIQVNYPSRCLLSLNDVLERLNHTCITFPFVNRS